MAETLQDFLISVKYSVDAASQGNFLSQLKRVAGSVSGVAAEIVGLTGGIVALTKVMAETGEKFYWMADRMGSSVGDIQSASFALSQLGMSLEGAHAGLESFGAWQRSMGGAASGFLKSLGVTAGGATEQLEQLGEALRKMDYPIALRYAQMMGISEQMMRGIMSGQFAKDNARAGFLQRAVWGPEGSPDKWATESNKVMRVFREFGLIFDALKQKFAVGLFEQILPKLIEFQKMLLDNMPLIRDWIDKAAKGLGIFVDLVKLSVKTFLELPNAVKGVLVAIVGFGPALALAKSPVFQFITAITTLMLLLDDYKHWQKDPTTSELDWGGFDKLLTGFTDMLKPMDDWIEKQTGIQNGMEWLIGGVVAAGLLGLTGKFTGIVGEVAKLAGYFTPAGILMKGLAALAAVGLGNAAINQSMATEAKKLGFDKQGGTWLNPIPTWKNSQTGETLTHHDMMMRLGADPTTGFSPTHLPDANAHPSVVQEHQDGAKSFWESVTDAVTDAAKRFLQGPEAIRQQHGSIAGNLFAGPGAPGFAPTLPTGGEFGQFLARNYAPAAANANVGVGSLAGGGGEANNIPAFEGSGAPPEMQLPGDYSWGDYGTRANNPGNMNFAPGQGAAGRFSYTDPQTGGKHTMGVFSTMQEGVAAAYRLLLRNQQRYGKTLAGALHGWAENSYIGPLAKSLGISTNEAFDLAKAEPGKVQQLMAEQFRREGRKGSHSATGEQILGGIELARDRLGTASTPPLGSQPAGAGQFLSDQHRQRSNGTNNHNTTINVQQGPTAQITADRVAERVHEVYVRNSEGRFAA